MFNDQKFTIEDIRRYFWDLDYNDFTFIQDFDQTSERSVSEFVLIIKIFPYMPPSRLSSICSLTVEEFLDFAFLHGCIWFMGQWKVESNNDILSLLSE